MDAHPGIPPMKRFISAVILATILLIPSSATTANSYNYPIASVRALWAVEINENTGEQGYQQICTVNSINEDIGLWLTAAHCTELGTVYVEQPKDGTEAIFHEAKVTYKDTPNDIAVLLTPTLRVVSFKIAGKSPNTGDHIRVYGYPLGLQTIQLFQGNIASLKTHILFGADDYGYRMMFDMTVCGGNSGSAVLSDTGEVISVLQLGFGRPCASYSGGVMYDAMVESVGKFFKK
jgi:S1-C subfamily serine protease